jgi:Holliday junction resolvasome RuvABC endonuclease subunit
MKIGIDYSLSCPGLCINTSEEEFRYEDCKFYYLTNTKKYEGTFKEKIAFGTSAVEYIGTPHRSYKDEPERYSNIADWFVEIVKSYYPPHQVSQTHPHINLEDYSFASKGRVFHIAENVGILKYKMKQNGWDYTLLAPSVIKKFATGKGNTNKEGMVGAFEKDTGVNLELLFDSSIKSPITDIADAYFICKYQANS